MIVPIARKGAIGTVAFRSNLPHIHVTSARMLIDRAATRIAPTIAG